MNVVGKTAVVTGGASGIGAEVVRQLLQADVRHVAVVDRDPAIGPFVAELRTRFGADRASEHQGDVTDDAFRVAVFDALVARHAAPSICVPAAGVTRDRLAVKIDRDSGRPSLYPIDHFRLVLDVNLTAPVYWTLEMIARIAADRHGRGAGRWTGGEPIEGVAVLVGSVSSQGNRGQVAYAASKAGLEGAAATLASEGRYYGVRCAVVHPGFTDTPMVRAMGDEVIRKAVLPATRIDRLIDVGEIADAIGLVIRNDAISGPLWADGGWRPAP